MNLDLTWFLLDLSTLSNRTFGKDICNWTGLNKHKRQEDAAAAQGEGEVKIDVGEEQEAEDGVVGEAISVAQGEEAANLEESMTNTTA